VDRHLTVSGFVVHEGRVALHWHPKLGFWLPAGGHIEPGEDPVEAVLREVEEEFALKAEPLRLVERPSYDGPRQIEPPYAIQNCVIAPGHQHIDLVYFLRHVSGFPGRNYDTANPIVWADAGMLASGVLYRDGEASELHADVQALGTEAIRLAEQVEAAAAPRGTG
jgi:8-oxo-dGTP pyrophosphatase MutT (NUDIX family)